MAKHVWKLIISAVLITLLWLGLAGSRTWAGCEVTGRPTLIVELGRGCEVTLDRDLKRFGVGVWLGRAVGVDVFAQHHPCKGSGLTGHLDLWGLPIHGQLGFDEGWTMGLAMDSSRRTYADLGCDRSSELPDTGMTPNRLNDLTPVSDADKVEVK
jgi:hypothetical protein